jgi:DNA-binding winged helix-turn-helix (wHTH) protein
LPRYRFDSFTISPRRRMLLQNGQEQPLIPRYFDLLVFLIERRHEAVHRRDIFDRVWADVIVSDSALSQAIRTLRRTLGDDSREPRYIRTVSRHGYRFVFQEVIEEDDDGEVRAPSASPVAAMTLRQSEAAAFPRQETMPDAAMAVGPSPDLAPGPAPGLASEPARESEPEPEPSKPLEDPFEPLLARLSRVATTDLEEEDQREAAEILLGLGTAEALRRLGTREGHSIARALLRDARWTTPSAGAVPFLGEPGAASAAFHLIRLRGRRAARIATLRWAAAATTSGLTGAGAGIAGGIALAAAPGSTAPLALSAVLALIGGVCGATGGAGVGAGLAAAEATARSWRKTALVVGGALGGAVAGFLAQWLGQLTLATLFGVDLPLGGTLDGVVIGGAAGLAYALGTARSSDGLAAPRGAQRSRIVLLMAAVCGLATLSLTAAWVWILIVAAVSVIAIVVVVGLSRRGRGGEDAEKPAE